MFLNASVIFCKENIFKKVKANYYLGLTRYESGSGTFKVRLLYKSLSLDLYGASGKRCNPFDCVRLLPCYHLCPSHLLTIYWRTPIYSTCEQRPWRSRLWCSVIPSLPWHCKCRKLLIFYPIPCLKPKYCVCF